MAPASSNSSSIYRRTSNEKRFLARIDEPEKELETQPGDIEEPQILEATI